MRSLTVKIEWDRPETEEEWLDAEGIANIMHHYYKDIKFKVSQIFGMRDELTASEALFGFVGWLTTQADQTVMSGHDDMGRIAELVDLFCKTNKLSEPRVNWDENLEHPDWVAPSAAEPGEEPGNQRFNFRWWFYNLAYLFIGKTRWWATVGPKFWE